VPFAIHLRNVRNIQSNPFEITGGVNREVDTDETKKPTVNVEEPLPNDQAIQVDAPKQDSAAQKAENVNRWYRRPEIINLMFTFAIVVIYGTQAYFMHGQWNEMISTGKQTDELLRIANQQMENTRKLATVGENANELAREALNKTELRTKEATQFSRDTISREQRPWVSTGPIRIYNKPTEDQPIRIRIQFLNGGRSPAVYLLHYTVFKPWILPSGDLNVPLISDSAITQCSKPKPKWGPDLGGAIMQPGDTNTYIERQSPVLNKDIVNVIMKKEPGYEKSTGLRGIPQSPASAKAEKLTLGLYLVGCIDYFDQFRNAHRTAFCYHYDPFGTPPNGDFANCARGNFAD
jgi:hypothetical protein